MSVAIVSILLLEIGDFSVRIKQKKRFLICPVISPTRHCKNTSFFEQCNALQEYYFFKGIYFIFMANKNSTYNNGKIKVHSTIQFELLNSPS